MEVLDLRSRSVRFLERYWRRPAAAVLGPLVGLTALVTEAGIRLRVATRPRPPAEALVVSVGNLALGGTGKTPVVRRLALDLAALGWRGAILSRGFGSTLPGPLVVRPGDAEAGDEPRLLAATLEPTDWVVVQSRNRRRGLRRILERRPRPHVVLVEDGHQTAGVPRHLDVLILDRWRTEQSNDGARVVPETGAVFPWGPYRETAAGARRAAVWLVESAAGEPTLSRDGGSRVLGFRRYPMLKDRPPGPHGLLAGIAVPERFEADAGRLLGEPVRLAVRCDDHCRYPPALVEQILAAGRSAGCRGWLTTEKDWVKLAGLWPQDVPIVPVPLEVAWASTQALPDLIGERLREEAPSRAD